MEPLINFRLSIDRLNEKEFAIFRNKWMSLLNRDIITSLIFNHFYKNKSQENDDNYNLNIIMNTIANIIKQRKKPKSKQISLPINETDEEPIKIIKLNELPSELIGEISSFLILGEHTNFALSNRQIYVSCNNPSRLVHFWLFPGRAISNVRTKYPLIECFTFEADALALYMMEHPNNNNNIFNHLNVLQNIESFIQYNNLINLTAITRLSLCGADPDQEPMDICRYLSHFPNLRCLDVQEMQFTHNNNDELLRQLLPELRVFWAADCTNSMVNKMIYVYGDQLEGLVLQNQNSLNIDSKNGFGKLIDLSLSAPSIKSIHNILNTTNILKRFAISMVPETNLSAKEFEVVILKLFKTQKSLEYIGFEIAYNNWHKIANILNTALGTNKDRKKKEFRIKYIVKDTQQIEMKEIKKIVQNLISLVNELVTNDFMVEIKFEGLKGEIVSMDDEEIKNEMIKHFNDTFVCILESDDRKSYQRFIITNKDCTICGYTERWLK